MSGQDYSHDAVMARIAADRAGRDEARRRYNLSPTERAYEDEFGREAMERQRELAKTLWACCGEHRDGPHHEACSKYVADAPPVVHEDQEALL